MDTTAPNTGSASPPGPPAGEWRRRLAIAGVSCAAVVSLAVVAGVILARATPAWWPALDRADAGRAGASEAGAQLQNSVINQMHLARAAAADQKPGEPWRSVEWRVALKSADVNAWLVNELPKWMANREPPLRWPAQVEAVGISFAPGCVLVGARVKHGERSSVISASLEPRVDGEGSLWLEARWLRIGRLPAPASWVVPRLREALTDPDSDAKGLAHRIGAEGLLLALSGDEPLAKSPVARLEDGRRVRLMDLEVREGEVWVTCRTEMAKGK